MSSTKQMEKDGVMFVASETNKVYQHTAGLVVLDSSERPEFDFAHLRDFLIERISLIPHFRWKLHEVPMGLDRPYWVEDENFSYDHHIKRIALPSPGDRVALSEVVAHLYSRHLDRNKPLWEIWFIEGLEGGKSAVLQKLHHCMMDGQGASKLGELMCDFEPDPKSKKTVGESITNAKPGLVPSSLEQYTNTARYLMGLPRQMTQGIYGLVRPKIWEKFSWQKKPKKQKPVIPVTSFNADIGCDRAFVFGSLSLIDIKVVKDHFDVSVNDVVMALVSGALRRYLLAYSELPSDSLRTSIPVSLRVSSDGDADNFSNKLTTTSVTLATDIEDPVERLQAINHEAEESKNRARGGGVGVIEIFQLMPPIAISAMMAVVPPEQTLQVMGANLVISNVRGSSEPLYIAGARMETMYPMSILTGGLGINITCLSYVDKVDFGIALDPDLVPEPWSLIDGLDDTLAEYLNLCGKKKRIRKKTAVRKKTTKQSNPTDKAKPPVRKKAVARKSSRPVQRAATAKKATEE